VLHECATSTRPTSSMSGHHRSLRAPSTTRGTVPDQDSPPRVQPPQVGWLPSRSVKRRTTTFTTRGPWLPTALYQVSGRAKSLLPYRSAQAQVYRHRPRGVHRREARREACRVPRCTRARGVRTGPQRAPRACGVVRSTTRASKPPRSAAPRGRGATSRGARRPGSSGELFNQF